MAFLGRSAIQQAINDVIASADYTPPLPNLAIEVWNTVLDWDKHRFSNNRLEWLGDGLMYAAISVELYRQIPAGNPHMYTVVRGPILTNQTFALLSDKMNISGALIRGPTSKARAPPLTHKCYADLFEVIPAEVYLRGGFDILCQWVAEVFGPLIEVAVAAYKTQPPILLKKRKRFEGPNEPGGSKPSKSLKTSHDYNPLGIPRKLFGANVPAPPIMCSVSSKAPAQDTCLQNSSQASVLGSASSNSQSSRTDMPTWSGPADASAGKALSGVSKNAVNFSRMQTQTGLEASRKVKPGALFSAQSMVPNAHSVAWERALRPAAEPGPSRVHAVLASPSRYIVAPPSAPACGPGSSRFDPIIIDDEEDSENSPHIAGIASREVIEISDDEEQIHLGSGSEVEDLIAPIQTEFEALHKKATRKSPRKLRNATNDVLGKGKAIA